MRLRCGKTAAVDLNICNSASKRAGIEVASGLRKPQSPSLKQTQFVHSHERHQRASAFTVAGHELRCGTHYQRRRSRLDPGATKERDERTKTKGTAHWDVIEGHPRPLATKPCRRTLWTQAAPPMGRQRNTPLTATARHTNNHTSPNAVL
jgi:hypothetical protein